MTQTQTVPLTFEVVIDQPGDDDHSHFMRVFACMGEYRRKVLVRSFDVIVGAEDPAYIALLEVQRAMEGL